MSIFDIFLNKKKYTNNEPQYQSRFFVGGKFTTVNEETAMTIAAFNRGVIYIATQMAKLPFNVKTNKKELVEDHSLFYLLNRAPNSENSAFILKCFLFISAIVKGNGYLEIERNLRGDVVALWPILADDVTLRRLSTGRLVYQIANGTKGVLFMRPENIFHLRNFQNLDALSGQGVVGYAGETLGISLGANRFANSLFANSGMPSGSINVTGKLSQDASERIKEGWQSASAGRKTGSVVVLEEGTTFSPITFAPDVLQFIESRKFGIPEIARFLGVPPTKLYSQEQATYNNNEQDNLSVVNDTLSAWATNIENEADVKLLGKDIKHHTEMDLFEVAKGDMKTRGAYYKDMMSVGAITPNQIRKAEGRPPYEGGDRYYIATNNLTPSDKVDEVILNNTKQPEKSPLEEAAQNYLENKK